MDVAKLRYEIDSSQAKTAKTNLGGMSKAARDAEDSQKGLGSTSTRAGREIVAANTNVARSATGVTRAYKAMRIGALAAIAAIAAGMTAAARSLGKFVSSTVEAQRVQAQLAAALRSTGGASGQTVASLNAHAAALQKVTLFGDEATNAAQGVLLTFTRIRGDVFPRATEAVQDLAQALGQSLQGAAIQVGKALNDPATGLTLLTRSGITFSEAQKAVIKDLVATNRLTEAQGVILKELETQFGGSARAARTTLGGALAGLKNAFGDLFEISVPGSERLRVSIEGLANAFANPAFMGFVQAIGTALFGALGLATDALAKLLSMLPVVAEYATVAGAALLVAFGPTILAAVGSFTVAVGVGAVGAVKALTVAMLANPLGALAVAFTTAVVAAYHFRDEIEKAIGIDVVEIAKSAANLLIGSFVAAYEDIKFVWQNFGNMMGAAVIGGVNLAIDAINTLFNGAKMSVNDLINTINLIPGVDIEGMDTNSSTIGSVANPYADALSGALSARNEAVSSAMSADYIGSIGAAYSKSTPEVKSFGAALDGVADSATGAGAALGKAANDNKDPWKGLRGEVDRTKDSMDFAKGAAKGFLSDLRSGLKNTEGFWRSFGNAALGVLDKIINKIESQLVEALFSASSPGGGGLFGSIFGGLGRILGFANGTNYAPGGLAMVGERGPELVELPRGSRVNTANETRRMTTPVNNNGQSIKVVTESRVYVDENGNWAAEVERISQEQITQAAPAIINQSTSRVLPTVAEYQGNRSGSDFRVR